MDQYWRPYSLPDIVSIVVHRNIEDVTTKFIMAEDIYSMLSTKTREELQKPNFAIFQDRMMIDKPFPVFSFDKNGKININFDLDAEGICTKEVSAEESLVELCHVINEISKDKNIYFQPERMESADLLLFRNKRLMHFRDAVPRLPGSDNGKERWLSRLYFNEKSDEAVGGMRHF